jgi:cholinesterase
LRDIRLSLEWVRDNIENFGGDPKRIVIFGGAVDFYAFTNTEDPIVSGFIAQSGSAFTRGIAEESNLDVWYQMSSKMGCGGNETGAKTVNCVRQKNGRIS